MTTSAQLTDSWSVVQKLVEDLRGSVLQAYCASEDEAAGLTAELVKSLRVLADHCSRARVASHILQQGAASRSGRKSIAAQTATSQQKEQPPPLLTLPTSQSNEQPLHALTQIVLDQNKPEGHQATASGQQQASPSLSQSSSGTAVQHAGQHQALQQQRLSMREAAQLQKNQQFAQAAELPTGAVAFSSRPAAAANSMHDAHAQAQATEPMALQPTTSTQPSVQQPPQRPASEQPPSHSAPPNQLPSSAALSPQVPLQPQQQRQPISEPQKPVVLTAPAVMQAQPDLANQQSAVEQASAEVALQSSSEPAAAEQAPAEVTRRPRKKPAGRKRKAWFEDSELPTAKQAVDWLRIAAKAPFEAPQGDLQLEDRQKELVKFVMAAKPDVQHSMLGP